MKYLSIPLFIAIILVFSNCNDDNPKPNGNGDQKPEELEITSFKITNTNPVSVGEIDTITHDIYVNVPAFTDISKLMVEVEYTDSADLTPPSGYAYNFKEPLTFKVEKNDSTVEYVVYVNTSLSNENELKKIILPELRIEQLVTDTIDTINVSYGTKLTDVLVEFEISKNATVNPSSGSRIDFTQPQQIVVTSESGLEQTYTFNINEADQDIAVRAFWIPAPWHSPFLRSYDNILQGVALAKELKFNTLFVGAWAQNRSLYPSQVLADNSSYATPQDGAFWDYTGETGDVVADLVQVAHDNGLKVILWYEYGFMARVGSAPTADNNPILAVHPDWVGVNKDGGASNYNGTDYYFNAYHDEVQQFMIDFVMEAVNKYDIDGIQGDDRMPAMPNNSGYDDFTVAKYKAEHDGQEPPLDITNGPWVRWRADILNNFWKTMYDTVKLVNPECIVACAPNPYPWAFNNLMQEWPVWLEQGTVEMLSVQIYRSSLSSYRNTLSEALFYFNEYSDKNIKRFVPGILLYGSTGLVDPELLDQQMKHNRTKGVKGESFFYDVPLENEEIQAVIKSYYTGEALFPEF